MGCLSQSTSSLRRRCTSFTFFSFLPFLTLPRPYPPILILQRSPPLAPLPPEWPLQPPSSHPRATLQPPRSTHSFIPLIFLRFSLQRAISLLLSPPPVAAARASFNILPALSPPSPPARPPAPDSILMDCPGGGAEAGRRGGASRGRG
jgi:hypothetical protein